MQQDLGALDVAQEPVAQAVTVVGTLDQSGDVSHHKAIEFPHADDAEIGLQGGEGVVSDLGPGCGNLGDQGRLAGVGKPDQAHIGQQLQAQGQGQGLALGAVLGIPRRPVGGRLEVHVAPAAVSSARNDELLVGGVEVVQQFVRLGIVDQRAGRDL